MNLVEQAEKLPGEELRQLTRATSAESGGFGGSGGGGASGSKRKHKRKKTSKSNCSIVQKELQQRGTTTTTKASPSRASVEGDDESRTDARTSSLRTRANEIKITI